MFDYAIGKGAKAACLPDQISELVRAQRSDVLSELNEKNKKLYEEAWLGRPCQILFEENVTAEEKEYYTGYTKEYIKAFLTADQNYENQILSGTLGREEDGLLILKRD